MDKRIAFVGTGALGGYVGGYFAHHGFDVTLIDMWPENIEAIRSRTATRRGTVVCESSSSSYHATPPGSAFTEFGDTRQFERLPGRFQKHP